MSKFIKLTMVYGHNEDTEPVWINVNKISHVKEYISGAWVYIVGGSTYNATETPTEILAMIEGNKEAELLALIDSIYDELTNREVNSNYEISLETFNKITEVVNATGQD